MDKQRAEELKKYIDALVVDNYSIVKHQCVHLLLSSLESEHKQIHRDDGGCNFHNK